MIIGWDGADWEILDDLLSRGVLPNLASMLRDGARGTLASTIPAHSWAAWSSFLTGMHPAGHGVFDFVERHPTEPRRRVPIASTSIRATTFLERLSTAGHEVRCANVPVTFPPIPIRGKMISGVAIPGGAPFVYPSSWADELAVRAPFPINGMEWVRFREDPMALVAEAHRLVAARTASFQVLLEGDWTVAVCVFVAPDRLQHPLGSHLLPSHPDFAQHAETPLAEALREVFRALDSGLERLIDRAGPDATTIVMSDHGFRPVTRLSKLNRLLEVLGFAAPARTAPATGALRRSRLARAVAGSRLGHSIKRRMRAPSTLDWSRTLAYQSVSGGGVSLNLVGREPDGIVAVADYDRVRDEVRRALLDYRDTETGQAPVDGVLVREDLPPGPYLDLASDLIVRPSYLWSFAHSEGLAEWTDWPSGSHRREGILAASGGRASRGSLGDRSITDLAATALAFAGVGAGGLDGTAIEEVSGRALAEGGAALVPVDRRGSGEELTDEEHEAVARHLRDLGYIE